MSIREAAAKLAAESRAAQGLPPTIDDEGVLASVAATIRPAGSPDRSNLGR